MKKLLLFFAVIVVALIGCDHSCYSVLKIRNQTELDVVVVDVNNTKERITITPGSEQVVVKRGPWTCGKGDGMKDILYGREDVEVLTNAVITIGGEPASEIIWKRKYWEFFGEPLISTYILTITEELLEILRLEEEL